MKKLIIITQDSFSLETVLIILSKYVLKRRVLFRLSPIREARKNVQIINFFFEIKNQNYQYWLSSCILISSPNFWPLKRGITTLLNPRLLLAVSYSVLVDLGDSLALLKWKRVFYEKYLIIKKSIGLKISYIFVEPRHLFIAK